ncbi:hypothetical protein [Aquabacter cavernae]|uniref:hypothetical protein n=1 Tax=Aquabacter cavernae TaxID=2496029 RepID=UPI001FE0E512|nr:hypothetical protein [Aquabacter cavernae]
MSGHMKAGIGGVALAAALLLSGVAQAQQGMPNTRTMSCPQVQSLVARSPGVVLATGPNTFDRYVSNVRFCAGSEQIKPEWVPSKDGTCYVGGGTCWDPSTFYGNR